MRLRSHTGVIQFRGQKTKENRSMKKSFLVLCLIIIVCLSACGGSTAVIQNTASSAATEPMIPIESTIPDIPVMTQRHILENNQSLWEFSDPFESPWFYTYTDLDHNGRLEVIAVTTQGSGIFTYAHYWEVLPDGSGIRNCWHENVEIEGPDDWPEIILDSLPCYYDRASDRYYYPCEGVTRIGAAQQYWAWYALCLKDGIADWELLVSKQIDWDEHGEHVSCQDAAGNSIYEQDYNSAVERHFAGMEKSILPLSWTQVNIPWEEPAA